MIYRTTPKSVMRFIRFWPPYLAAGISVKEFNEDFTTIKVQMKQRITNTNYVGTHFGGSLYSMCDPFYMFILLRHLSKEHIVWDKSAEIEFVRPGKGTVTAEFHIPMSDIEDIRQQCLKQFKLTPFYQSEIIDEHGEVVAKVKKGLYVRRKDAKERFTRPVDLGSKDCCLD